MKALKAYKYRLEPTDEQIAILIVLLGHARFVWNQALAECLRMRKAGERLPGYMEYGGFSSWVTYWKEQEETAFLKGAYTDNLQQKLKDLHKAWGRFFEKLKSGEVAKEIARRKAAGKPIKHTPFEPRFKKKGHDTDSIRFVNFSKYCELGQGRVKLPKQVGWVKFRQSRPVEGVIKNCTVSFSGGKWYISFQVEQEIAQPAHPSTSAIGVDVGIARFAACSDGSGKAPLNSFRKHEKKLATAQRKLSRKVKFSANWKKQKAKINRLHSRIANCRLDYLHKASTELSKNHAMIAVEDLQVANMSRSAKGTTEQPGKNVKAKSGLNKAILDQGWGEFRRQLEYKQVWRGGLLIAVPPQYTSQTCPACLHVSKDNRQTQAHFECVACGFAENADTVGAINVLRRAHELLAGQDYARSACEVNCISGQQQEPARPAMV